MPFDLDRTRHSFVKDETGGVQSVVALEYGDAEQVALIREHLREISVAFSKGRYEDPSSIHGDDMPGLRELAAGAENVVVEYREIDAGGEIRYSSSDAALVAAVHNWFDAQLADHGHDATNTPSHVITEEMWRMHHPGEPYPGSGDEVAPNGG